MPNHTTNLLTIEGPNAKAILKSYISRNEEGEPVFDFNKVIPKPTIYADIFKGLGIRCFLSYSNEEEAKLIKAKDTEGLREFRAMRELIQQGQPPDPLTWATANWGTKWNSYDCGTPYGSAKKAFMRLHTAWSPPIPIVEKLSELHPDHKFTIMFSDEGGGFLGACHYERGVLMVEEDVPWRDPEGIKIRKKLHTIDSDELLEIREAAKQARREKQQFARDKKRAQKALKLPKQPKPLTVKLNLV